MLKFKNTSLTPSCADGSKKPVDTLAVLASKNTLPVTTLLPYEKFICAYGVGTTPVCEKVSRSSGTTGGACSTSLL